MRLCREEMEYMEPLNTKIKPLKQLKVTVFKAKQLLQTTKGKPDEKRKVVCDKSVLPTFYFQHHDQKVKRIIVNVIRPILTSQF